MKVGGQALIEGVMMKTSDCYSISVRKPNNTILTVKRKFNSLTKKKPYNLPFLRGIIILGEMLGIGFKALNFSAKVSGQEEEELSPTATVFTIAASIVFVILIFKLFPLMIANFISPNSYFLYNLTDGISKLLLFLIYLLLISRMKDVQTTFQYHGAEHKAIHCYESEKKLTIKNVQSFQTMHPRCGTSFIAWVILTSVVVYMIIPLTFGFLGKLLTRLLLLPIIAGISYEILRLTSGNNLISRILALPGILIQKITTKEPTNKQVEVAIAALNKVIK
jgi:uncharacterized protein YqhQ